MRFAISISILSSSSSNSNITFDKNDFIVKDSTITNISEIENLKTYYNYENIILFRGLTFYKDEYSELTKKKITDNKFFKHQSEETSSWTIDKKIASDIAQGKDVSLDTVRDFGIVIKYNFNKSDIIFDYNVFDSQDLENLGFEFLYQREVLVKEGSYKSSIISFIRHD